MIVTVLKPSPKSLTNWAGEALGTVDEHGSRTYSQYQVDDIAGDTSARNLVQVPHPPFQIRSSSDIDGNPSAQRGGIGIRPVSWV